MNDSYPTHELTRPDFATLADASPLWQVIKPPFKLFIQGKPEALALLEKLPENGLAVVGTRNPQPRSQALVRKIIAELKGTPLIIISGFARGIDTEAHLAALETGLPTLAILGTPLEINYPAENFPLRKKILAEGGLLISEFPKASSFYASHFILRNRLIAGWAKATWIVEAGFKSGALNTAKWARDQHRTCFATPCFPGDPALAGTQKLLDRDEAIPLWRTEGLGASWSSLATPFQVRKRRFQERSSQEEQPASDSEALRYQIELRTAENGGVTVQGILDWALHQGWSPQKFFTAFQKALEDGRLREEEGILMTSERGKS